MSSCVDFVLTFTDSKVGIFTHIGKYTACTMSYIFWYPKVEASAVIHNMVSISAVAECVYELFLMVGSVYTNFPW